MKKLTLSMMVVLMGIGTAFAQISTGEPNASVLPRTGNRPQAGDFGMYLGVSATQIADLATLNKKMTDDAVQTYWALPMINLKYYITDQWEFRCGFEFAAKSTTESYAGTIGKDKTSTSNKEFTNSNFTRFLPGAAYHFNTNNILDVYIGAQMPIGFNVNDIKNTSMYDGKKSSEAWHQGEFVLGGGVFLGLQFFVADLPFAIGFEGGYAGQAILGNNEGMTTIVDEDGNKYKYAGNQLGRTPSESDEQATKSTFMEGTWHADAAITFTYYFRN